MTWTKHHERLAKFSRGAGENVTEVLGGHDEPLEFYSTLLLRFRDENGKLVVEQYDRCLGNANHYDTIAAARTALGKCSGAK